jgi:photosystem II stability/assembly factor-like uncharacterized protein
MRKFFFLSFAISLLLSGKIIFAQNFDWEWQNPFPTGADHNDAIVLSTTKFMLFGNGGSVLLSTDAGESWSISYVDPAGRDIYSATFVDQNIGYIAGTGGLIMKTTDGGINWIAQTSGTTNVLWDVYFTNATTGFAVGASGIILSTTNGGDTWTPSSFGTTTLYKLHFINGSLGYMGSASATTGRLLRTTDGGATWNDISANVPGLSGTVRGIHFIGENTGWISNSVGRIYKTTNGGTNWSEIYYVGASVTIYEIKFIDVDNGFALTTAGRVLKTTNGGTNWDLIQTAATKNLFGLGILGLHQFRGTTPILIGGDIGTIIKSTDSGVTWQIGHTAASQELLHRGYFPSETVGYVVGGSITTGNSFGDILKTTNGGATWTKLPFDPGYRTYSVFFHNENVGYVGVQGPTGLYKTTNGGQDWTQLNTGTGGSTNIIYDIKFYDDNLGFAVYSSGQVARTTDGGGSWTPVSVFTAAAAYEIFIVNSNVMYVCGAGGRVSKSINGGASFFQATANLNSSILWGMHFFDENTGFIAGSSGRLFKTTNGSVFTEIQLPVTSQFYPLYFVNSNIGWIGGASGNVLYTENGGDTWTESHLSVGSTQTIRDMGIAGNRLWLIGSDGLIIAGYTDPQIPVELASFTASTNDGKVLLNWVTASELNNRGFEIERASSRQVGTMPVQGWEKIGFVAGFGTTTETKSYFFIDENPFIGKNYYRLKQIDFDGSFEYSETIEVDFNIPLRFALEQNYPNPFNPSTTINFELTQKGLVSLKVYDILGNLVTTLVNEEMAAGKHLISFDASGLASGVYFYTLSSKEGTINKKMLLLK